MAQKNTKNERILEIWGETAPPKAEFLGESLNFMDQSVLRKHKLKNSKKQIIIFLALFCLFLLVSQGVNIIVSGLNAKAAVTQNAASGLFYLQQAQKAFQDNNLNTAQQQFIYAQQHFIVANNDLDSLNIFLKTLLRTTAEGNNAKRLVLAGKYISDVGLNFNNFKGLFSEVKSGPDGFSAPDGFYGTVNAAKKYLQLASVDLSAAREALSKVTVAALPEEQRSQFLKQLPNLELADNLFAQGYKLLDLFHNFFGPGTKTILVLFENNAELRPGGGFIGTYGFFKFENGKFVQQKITSVYDLDGQISQKIAPPGQFRELTDRFGLRDSNWFADFKNSAKKASDFYEMVGRETPDAVIALTPDLFVELLRITGPVAMPKYGIILSADNFREMVQHNTKESFDNGNSSPKQLLADFAPVFLQALAALPQGTDFDLIATLLSQLQQKNILFYDRNQQIENVFAEYNWSGTVAASAGDYLQIISANLGGTKSDLGTTTAVKLKTDFTADGDIINTLTYLRTVQEDLVPSGKNISYVRFYVPKGSVLLSADGFTPRPFYPADGSAYPEEDIISFKTDRDLAALDHSVKTHQSGTIIGEESGKTFFGNWIEISPGQSSTAVIRYKLPLKQPRGTYSLTLQKQAGALPIDFEYSASLPGEVTWSTPEQLQVSKNAARCLLQLNADKFIGILFKEPDAGK